MAFPLEVRKPLPVALVDPSDRQRLRKLMRTLRGPLDERPYLHLPSSGVFGVSPILQRVQCLTIGVFVVFFIVRCKLCVLERVAQPLNISVNCILSESLTFGTTLIRTGLFAVIINADLNPDYAPPNEESSDPEEALMASGEYEDDDSDLDEQSMKHSGTAMLASLFVDYLKKRIELDQTSS